VQTGRLRAAQMPEPEDLPEEIMRSRERRRSGQNPLKTASALGETRGSGGFRLSSRMVFARKFEESS
jgi:hypothetical protein